MLSIFIFKWVEGAYYDENGGIEVNRKWYKDNGGLREDGVEGNAIFIFVNNIYLFSVLAFNISSPWRKEFWTNVPLVIVAVLALAYNVVSTVVPAAAWS